MSNIIKFPNASKPSSARPEPLATADQVRSPAPAAEPPPLARFVRGLITAVWMTTVLVWPLLKWGLSLVVLYQLLRTAYHWDTPDVHAGWTAAAYFAALVALNCFVALYTPKGWKA